MIPVFLSLHVSVTSFRGNYAQLPLSSLTEDAPRDGPVNQRYQVCDLANENKEPSCEKRIKINCSGSAFTVVQCRESSLTACHKSIRRYGIKKCKPLQFEYITKCGESFPTKCGCA